MGKQLALKHIYDPSAYSVHEVSDLLEMGLCRSEDAQDQAQRIEVTRECIGRLIQELYDVGVLGPEAVARIVGFNEIDIGEVPAK